MSIIDVDRLLQEISPESRSGENLEYDPAFMQLESDVEGTPSVEVDQKVLQEAREPDWSKIQASALELLTRSHDLRTAAILIRALLHTAGLAGFHDGLRVVHGFAERYWDSFHPLLDADDDNDPTERINAFESMTDWDTIVGPLVKARLCASREGTVSLRQWRIANGNLAGLVLSEEEKENPPDSAAIQAVFAQSGADEVQEASENTRGSLEELYALKTLLDETLGSTRAPDFGQLIETLREIEALLAEQLSRLGVSESFEPADAPGPESGEAGDRASAGRRETGGGRVDRVESRKDVLRLLELICKYYEQFEPASPVPLLLGRAMRLVDKSFVEIIQDMVPDAMHQLQVISGAETDENM